MGLDLCKPCGNRFQAERQPGLPGGDCPCTAASCGSCGDRCCDICCQVCVEVCCGLCSGDCSYTFCTLCLSLTQDLFAGIAGRTPPSDVEGIMWHCGCQGVGGGDKRHWASDRRHDQSDSCWKLCGAWTGDCLISLECGPASEVSTYAFAMGWQAISQRVKGNQMLMLALLQRPLAREVSSKTNW
ncbi:unnamed protein product [Lota lota]